MTRNPGYLPAPLAATARAQFGCFTLEQAQRSGVPEWRVRTLVAVGLLDVLHSGVFRLSGAPRVEEQRAWAAYLSVGDPSAACAETAAWVLGWSGYELPRTPQLAVPNSRRPRTTLADVRHLSRWGTVAGSIRALRGIPVLPPEDVVMTIARDASVAAVLRAVQAAGYAHSLDLMGLVARTGRGVAGSARVRRAVATYAAGLDSAPEVRTYLTLSDAGIPPDHTNVVLVGRHQRVGPVDGYFDCGLAYEYDGAHHRRPSRRRSDTVKQARGRRLDIALLRFDRGWLAQPDAMTAAVRDGVARRALRPPPDVTVEHLDGRSCACGKRGAAPPPRELWTGS